MKTIEQWVNIEFANRSKADRLDIKNGIELYLQQHPQGLTPDQLKEYREWLEGEIKENEATSDKVNSGRYEHDTSYANTAIALQYALDKLNQLTK